MRNSAGIRGKTVLPELKRIHGKDPDHENAIEARERNGVPYLVFPSFEKIQGVIHGFSTRLGGVSSGDCATMNFAVNRGDTPENVHENYRRMAAALDFSPEQMVLSWQTHTTNIRMVTADDAGKGYNRDRDYRDVDGLMTDVPGIILVTFYADCVPLLFVDPVRRVAAASHAGWRGTVAGMARRTVEAMEQNYGCRAEDLIVGIGPSICRNCYQVGEDVACEFLSSFSWAGESGVVSPDPDLEDHFLLDLQECNRRVLLAAGVPAENITVTDLCTCCNRDLLFSHRGSRGHRGTMAAFLGLC